MRLLNRGERGLLDKGSDIVSKYGPLPEMGEITSCPWERRKSQTKRENNVPGEGSHYRETQMSSDIILIIYKKRALGKKSS